MNKRHVRGAHDSSPGPNRAPAAAVMLALLLLVPGCSKDGARGGGGFSMPPMPAEVADVVIGRIEENFQAVGTIEANEAVTIVAEIDGIVTSVPYREGAMLAKGDLIATLDDGQLSAEVSRTEALYAQAKGTYERVKAVVPVAGIADLHAHVCEGAVPRYRNGVISGHCDCMYPVNTYRWDFAMVAALVAPRPLLLGNSDAIVTDWRASRVAASMT